MSENYARRLVGEKRRGAGGGGGEGGGGGGASLGKRGTGGNVCFWGVG